MSQAISRPAESDRRLPGARPALVLLLLINLFNYIDRQVLAAVEPEIRPVLLSAGDANARAKMGLLSTAFLVTYMLLSPLFGILGDRHSRWGIIAIGVALWSLASGASGLAATFTMLLLTRCFVGVGEAAYGPVAPTIISDLYPVAERGKVLAWFYLAIPVGSALGYVVGEIFAGLNHEHQSWRWAFYAVVLPGLILAAWSYFMPEPKRGASDVVESRKATLADYLILLKTPSYLLDTAGMTAMTFAIGAVGWWMPEYLEHHKAPGLFGIGPRTVFGVITALAGLLGTLAGGITGDRLRPRFPGSYFLVSGIALFIGVPFLIGFVYTPFPYAWGMVFMAVFLLFFNTGPTNTILANVSHPSMRSTAFALNILIIHTLGDAISPPAVGAVIDHIGWRAAFISVSLFMLLGAVLWLLGIPYLARDTELATRRLQS